MHELRMGLCAMLLGAAPWIGLLEGCRPRTSPNLTGASRSVPAHGIHSTGAEGARRVTRANGPSQASVDPEYQPSPTSSGPAPKLPDVPWLPQRNRLARAGVYTVWGASFSLRHSALKPRIMGSIVQIHGVIGETNLLEAPLCAVHRVGLADPEGCKSSLPRFWLCDEVD